MREIMKKVADEVAHIFVCTILPILGGLTILYFYQP